MLRKRQKSGRRLIKKAQNMKVQDSMLGDREFWCSPSPGVVKCNVHINWRNGVLQSGGAWIARDHTGNVLFHGHDAFTSSPSRLIVELRGIIWVLRSARDI
ncbi:unnamed protein product, partial [Brassica oleracea var. botrytis]